jgi:hypothetical protein
MLNAMQGAWRTEETSSLRTQGSRSGAAWIPACAGMTTTLRARYVYTPKYITRSRRGVLLDALLCLLLGLLLERSLPFLFLLQGPLLCSLLLRCLLRRGPLGRRLLSCSALCGSGLGWIWTYRCHAQMRSRGCGRAWMLAGAWVEFAAGAAFAADVLDGAARVGAAVGVSDLASALTCLQYASSPVTPEAIFVQGI